MIRRAAFTLIELVVIILILGILAGVAAPRLWKSTASANDNALKQTLRVVRDAIDMYSNQNRGAMPPCTGNGSDFKAAVAEYLRRGIPDSPAGAKNSDIVGTTDDPLLGDSSPTAGWKFNTQTGAFICNSREVSLTGARYDEF